MTDDHRLGGLNKKIYFFTVSEVRSPRLRCRLTQVLVRTVRPDLLTATTSHALPCWRPPPHLPSRDFSSLHACGERGSLSKLSAVTFCRTLFLLDQGPTLVIRFNFPSTNPCLQIQACWGLGPTQKLGEGRHKAVQSLTKKLYSTSLPFA